MKHGYWALFVFSFLLIALGAAPLGAAFHFYPVSDGLRDAVHCRVAAQGNWAVVAWVEADSVWTRTWANGVLEPAVNHGPGDWPDVAVDGRAILAYEHQGAIHVKEERGQGWTEEIVYAFALDVHGPRLTLWQKDGWFAHGVYLCFQTDYGTVRFANRVQGVWQEAENALELGGFGYPHFAQAVPVPDGQSWRPRIYAMGETNLYYSDRVGGIWQAPVAIHEDEFLYGGEFAVAEGLDNEQHVLSNGPQPTCPCNVVHYTHGGLAGPWSDPENLTVEADYYTWPRNPAIAVDAANRVHAVWFQQHYSMTMEPTWLGLYYQVRDGGVWTDYSEPFCCMRGEWADMDLRFDYTPILVFTQAYEAPSQVVMALDPDVTATPTAPAARLALGVHPNPFNPKTTLRFALAAPATVTLAICDVSGRRLATLFAGALPAGEQRLDWDGRDDAGRELPSGVYLARLAGGSLRAQAKLVLLR